jgi:putative FmdB family regulatory protein
MPRRLFDFQCTSCEAVFEKLTDSEASSVDCTLCGNPSTRLISAPRAALDVISGDFPSATRKWALMRQQKIKTERRQVASHGPAND